MKVLSLVRVLLFAVALATPRLSQSTKLNLPLSGAQDVYRYEMSGDGKRVVYLADQDVVGVPNLYSVGLGGGEPKRLESRSCSQFMISPDSRRVVFSRFGSSLSSVPIDGSQASIDLAPYTNAFDVTSDGRTVVYMAGGSLNGSLYRVPIDGSSAPVPIDTSGNIHFLFKLTPDGRRVVYLREGTIRFQASMGHVCSAPLDGSGPPVVLNSLQSPCSIGSFVIDPTSAWLVFREGSQQTFSRGLFTVPLDGSAAPVLLNAPLGPGGALLSFTEFSRPRFTPDGSRVVYLLDVGSFRGDVYSAPIDGSKASIRLSAPPDNHTITFRITLDGGRVIYLADQEAAHAYELYSVPIRGDTPPIKVNAPLVPGGSVTTFKLSPDGKSLAYVADPELADHYEVYLAMLDPGHEVIRVSDPAVSPYVYPVTFSALEFVPDGSLLVYTGYDAGLQLYAVPLQGDRRPWRLDGPPVEGGSVQSSDAFPINSADDYNVRIGAHGKLAVYLADEDEDGVYELFASPLSRPRLGRR